MIINKIVIISGLILMGCIGWYANVSYSNIMVERSYNRILVQQYSDYLLPLVPQFHEAIKNEKDLAEFKKIHSNLVWLNIDRAEPSLKIAFVYSDESPSHIAVISNAKTYPESVEILTLKDFIQLINHKGTDKTPPANNHLEIKPE